jgi:AcrR family transcriptional regulator
VKKVIDAAESLRERKKARTREAILDAALELFAAKGFDATTVEDIAAAAEVSPRTFFRYFESKLDLVMAHNDAEAHKAFGALLAARPRDEDIVKAMREVLRGELEPRMHDPRIRREFEVMLTTPSLRHLAREHFHEEEAELVGAVAAPLGVPPGSLVAQVVTGMMASTIWSVFDHWVADGAHPDRIDEMMDDAFAMLAEGVDGAVAAIGD